ncbi:MAG TPA: DUF4339 domain-containing protein [Gemmataceae bacterium]|jgi:hypothetical protein|nr:DUF4339 domain-containing protein [Gemmataceae bacterium]
MADQWYYARDEDRHGPFTARQLKELAAAGEIHTTDTVWKEGVAQCVAAGNVKNLFSSAGPAIANEAAAAATAEEPLPPQERGQAAAVSPTPAKPATEDSDAGTGATEARSPGANQAPAPQALVRKGRAMAVRGALIVGQDGTVVHYRKKCTACGYEDVCRSRMPIRNGMTRVPFFCPKCRKVRQVEIQGIL